MDGAVASLLGALAGGTATFLGTVVNNVSQSRRDEHKEQLAKKAEAYGNALRNLLRVVHFRSGMGPSGNAFIGENQLADWFAAMVEAEYWVTILTAVCGSKFREKLAPAADDLTRVIGRLLKAPQDLPPKVPRGRGEPTGEIWQIYYTVADAARADLATRYRRGDAFRSFLRG